MKKDVIYRGGQKWVYSCNTNNAITNNTRINFHVLTAVNLL